MNWASRVWRAPVDVANTRAFSRRGANSASKASRSSSEPSGFRRSRSFPGVAASKGAIPGDVANPIALWPSFIAARAKNRSAKVLGSWVVPRCAWRSGERPKVIMSWQSSAKQPSRNFARRRRRVGSFDNGTSKRRTPTVSAVGAQNTIRAKKPKAISARLRMVASKWGLLLISRRSRIALPTFVRRDAGTSRYDKIRKDLKSLWQSRSASFHSCNPLESLAIAT